MAAAVSMVAWSAIFSYIILKTIDATIGLRLTPEHELIGSDIIEHGIEVGGMCECREPVPSCSTTSSAGEGGSGAYVFEELSPLDSTIRRLKDEGIDVDSDYTIKKQSRK